MMANCLPKLLAMLTAIFVWRADSCLSQPVDDAYGGKDKTLLPTKGWPCGMLEGIPVPERGVPVFVAAMKLDQVYDVGRTPYGQRKVYVVQSGTVTGEKINGSVMSGGLDFELSFSNGTIEVEQVLVLKTGDGKYIYLRTAGTAADFAAAFPLESTGSSSAARMPMMAMTTSSSMRVKPARKRTASLSSNVNGLLTSQLTTIQGGADYRCSSVFACHQPAQSIWIVWRIQHGRHKKRNSLLCGEDLRQSCCSGK